MAISTRRFMPPRQRDDLVVALLPERQVAQHFLDVSGVLLLAEQAAAERHGGPDGFERVGGQLLRHEADQRAGRTIVGADVVTVHRHAAFARVDDAADDADQRGLARAVRPEQREDFSTVDCQIDVLQCPKTAGIGFGQIRDRNDRLHGLDDGRHRC
ncbi:hypothetical protein QFZ96_007233 [Paraburkholderia youngii]